MTRLLLGISATCTAAGLITGLMVLLICALAAYAIERTAPR
jgi:hypothetical protein